ncbi:EF-hand domain-containing protein [Sneathiella sp.]|uniref:EF-hand domain-containing protein n=1 Tax=Sneathiella sp. TaxID=1964365 RepID=UPI002FE4218B
MKKIIMMLLAGSGLMLAASQPAHSFAEGRFLGIDRDADNLISMEELVAYRERLFKEYDQNGDGQVEFEEYVQARQLRSVTAPPYSKVEVPDEYREMDANGDTILTLEEVTAVGVTRFEKLDTNGDGKISKDEFVSPGL